MLVSEIGTQNTTLLSRERKIKSFISSALKDKNRSEIAAKLNVSKRQIDDWASPCKETLRFPASLVKPFCVATGSNDLALALLPDELLTLVEIGRRAVAADENFRQAWELLSTVKTGQTKSDTRQKKR